MDNVIFDQYSSSFAWVTPHCVAEVYAEAAKHVSGAIVDCGCGPCKFAPYLADNSNMTSYCGIDYSPKMVALGQQLLNQLQDPRFRVQCGDVADISGTYDCAVSLQSYYAWPNPEQSLSRVYHSLNSGGKLVLATVNSKLNIEALLKTASRDWLLNPLWQEYEAHNRQIVNNAQSIFESLDKLVGIIRCIGFELQEAHTQYYNGGLNFIVASK